MKENMKRPEGVVRIYKDGQCILCQKNQIQDGYKSILKHLLAGDTEYRPSVFYLEFQNEASPETPSFGTDAGFEYYNGLASPKDYLRVPLVLTPEVSETGITFSAVVGAGTGVKNALECGSDTLVYGAALAAETPEEVQIFSRFYLNTALALSGNAQYYITWTLSFS